MTLTHQGHPINTERGWMPACICSWRDPDHIEQEYQRALRWSLEHIARTPECWPEGDK